MKTLEASLKWIGHLLESIAKQNEVTITEWHWEEDTTFNTAQFMLTVTGAGCKRAMKLFSIHDIECCLNDNVLQVEIHSQLTRLVNYVGGKSSRESRKPKARQG